MCEELDYRKEVVWSFYVCTCIFSINSPIEHISFSNILSAISYDDSQQNLET
jgi:hypothetical protein